MSEKREPSIVGDRTGVKGPADRSGVVG